MGCVLRCVECPPVGGDTMWANMVLAYEKLPDAHQGADRRPARPPQHRAQLRRGHAEDAPGLKAQYPDAEHPVVRTHPETGEKVLFVNGFTTHFTNFHTPANVRFGQDYNRPARACCNYLISQAYIPEYQVRWRWKPAAWRSGTTAPPALRRDGLPALPPQDGARRDHRRHAF
jgi:taurine dioxygenase